MTLDLEQLGLKPGATMEQELALAGLLRDNPHAILGYCGEADETTRLISAIEEDVRRRWVEEDNAATFVARCLHTVW